MPIAYFFAKFSFGNEESRKSKHKSFNHHHDNSNQNSLISIMIKKWGLKRK
jgi:hypothetical protein